MPVKDVLYKCSWCGMTATQKAYMEEHVGECSCDPKLYGCGTCGNFRVFTRPSEVEDYGPEEVRCCLKILNFWDYQSDDHVYCAGHTSFGGEK